MTNTQDQLTTATRRREYCAARLARCDAQRAELEAADESYRKERLDVVTQALADGASEERIRERATINVSGNLRDDRSARDRREPQC